MILSKLLTLEESFDDFKEFINCGSTKASDWHKRGRSDITCEFVIIIIRKRHVRIDWRHGEIMNWNKINKGWW